MAKKKSKTKSSTRKRRRVSGIGTDLQTVAIALGGAIIANKVSAMLKSQSSDTMKKLAPYAGLVAGIALPMFVKNPLVKQLAFGMAVGGGMEALKALAPNLISGPYQLPVVSGRRRINGGVNNPGAIARVAGYTPANNSVNSTLSVISGLMRPSMNGSAAGM